MHKPEPTTLQTPRVRLEPMTADHAAGMEAAAGDGELWNLRITSVPAPGEMHAYIAAALKGCQDGHMLHFVVRDVASGTWPPASGPKPGPSCKTCWPSRAAARTNGRARC